ncbi:WYL domain-containing protein [Leptolyngbya sp. 15MV]|nr:WYL domain-containing protein [Leptolyngbya sp. 15MV]
MQHDPGQPGLLRVLSEAIVGRRMIQAHYNGAMRNLAPHLVYLRRGALYLGAFNPDKNWRGPEDHRLGHFNFAGLGEVEVSEAGFDPIAAFDGTAPEAEDTVLVTIDQPGEGD